MLHDREVAERYEQAVRVTEPSASWLPQADAPPAILPNKPTIEQIRKLQAVVAKLPQIHCEPVHYFAPGLYGRELSIPAEMVVVGKLHRHEHLVMLMKGDATVYTDKGMERIQAPRIWISPAGVKRAIYTHTDCTFATMHPTHETDLDKLEADIIVPELIEFEQPDIAGVIGN